MSINSLEQMIRTVVKKTIAKDFPFLKLPAVMVAVIIAVNVIDKNSVSRVQITDEVTGITTNVAVTTPWYEYTIRIFDHAGNMMNAGMGIPHIESTLQLVNGDYVLVGLPYGNISSPTIIAKVMP